MAWLKLAPAFPFCLLAILVGAPSAGSRETGPTGQLGINVGAVYAGESFRAIDREVATAQALHAKLIRVAMPWSSFEPNAAGVRSRATVAAADRLTADAAAAGIKVIVTAYSTPCWASSAPPPLVEECKSGRSGTAYAWAPREASSYAGFVHWLAARYGAQLAAIEVWNEPDQANQDYLAGPNKPQHYAQLLRAAYPAIKSANPNVKVLAGSLVGSNGAFMKALYRAGIKGYYDGVAVHFYNFVLASVRLFHEVQLANHDYTPLWLDEFGWPSCWPKLKLQQEQACVSQKVQAANVTSAFRELAQAPYIAAATIYKLQDSPGEDFGVLTSRGQPKRSFSALSRVLGSPVGPVAPVTLRLRVSNGQVVASGSGPVGDYMRLEVFQHGILRWRPYFTLNRFNDYSIPIPRALGTRGLTVRVFQYWQGSSHDTQRSI